MYWIPYSFGVFLCLVFGCGFFWKVRFPIFPHLKANICYSVSHSGFLIVWLSIHSLFFSPLSLSPWRKEQIIHRHMRTDCCLLMLPPRPPICVTKGTSSIHAASYSNFSGHGCYSSCFQSLRRQWLNSSVSQIMALRKVAVTPDLQLFFLRRSFSAAGAVLTLVIHHFPTRLRLSKWPLVSLVVSANSLQRGD